MSALTKKSNKKILEDVEGFSDPDFLSKNFIPYVTLDYFTLTVIDLETYQSILDCCNDFTNFQVELRFLTNEEIILKVLKEKKTQKPSENQGEPVIQPVLDDFIDDGDSANQPFSSHEKFLSHKGNHQDKVILINLYYGKNVMMQLPGAFAHEVFLEIMGRPKDFGNFHVSRLDFLLKPPNFLCLNKIDELRGFQDYQTKQVEFLFLKNYQKDIPLSVDYTLKPAFFKAMIGKRTTRRVVRIYSAPDQDKKHFLEKKIMSLYTLTKSMIKFYNVGWKTTYFSSVFGLVFKGYKKLPSDFELSELDSTVIMNDCSDLAQLHYTSNQAHMAKAASKLQVPITESLPAITVADHTVAVVSVPVDVVDVVEVVSSNGFWSNLATGWSSCLPSMPVQSIWKEICIGYPLKIVNLPIDIFQGIQVYLVGHSNFYVSFLLSLYFLAALAYCVINPPRFCAMIAELLRLGFTTACRAFKITLVEPITSAFNVFKRVFSNLLMGLHNYLLGYGLYVMIANGFLIAYHSLSIVKSVLYGFYAMIASFASGLYWWIKYLGFGDGSVCCEYIFSLFF